MITVANCIIQRRGKRNVTFSVVHLNEVTQAKFLNLISIFSWQLIHSLA